MHCLFATEKMLVLVLVLVRASTARYSSSEEETYNYILQSLTLCLHTYST